MQVQSVTADRTTSRPSNTVKINELRRIHIIVSFKARESYQSFKLMQGHLLCGQVLCKVVA